VPAATIGQDYYRHQEALHALVGDRTGEAYRLGDAVRVRLIEAVPSAGALRFEMLSPGSRLTAAAGKGRRSSFSDRRNARR
jgi:ribonuclease R